MSLFSLFEQFLKEKQFLIGISPKTIRSYQQAFKGYQRVLSGSGSVSRDDVPTKESFNRPLTVSLALTFEMLRQLGIALIDFLPEGIKRVFLGLITFLIVKILV
jgi:hypothetical protein